MDDLAQRLVRVAFDAAHEQRDRDWAPFKEGGGSYDLQAFFESEHRSALVAVLRELANDGDRTRLMFDADRLRALADSIENGA